MSWTTDSLVFCRSDGSTVSPHIWTWTRARPHTHIHTLMGFTWSAGAVSQQVKAHPAILPAMRRTGPGPL